MSARQLLLYLARPLSLAAWGVALGVVGYAAHLWLPLPAMSAPLLIDLWLGLVVLASVVVGMGSAWYWLDASWLQGSAQTTHRWSRIGKALGGFTLTALLCGTVAAYVLATHWAGRW